MEHRSPGTSRGKAAETLRGVLKVALAIAAMALWTGLLTEYGAPALMTAALR